MNERKQISVVDRARALLMKFHEASTSSCTASDINTRRRIAKNICNKLQSRLLSSSDFSNLLPLSITNTPCTNRVASRSGMNPCNTPAFSCGASSQILSSVPRLIIHVLRIVLDEVRADVSKKKVEGRNMKIQEEINILVELLRFGLSGTHPSEHVYDEVSLEYNLLVRGLDETSDHFVLLRDNLRLDAFTGDLAEDYEHKNHQADHSVADLVEQEMSSAKTSMEGICLKGCTEYQSTKASLYSEGVRVPLDFFPSPCNKTSIDSHRQSSGCDASFEQKTLLGVDYDRLLKVESVLNRSIESILSQPGYSGSTLILEEAKDELEKFNDYCVIDFPPGIWLWTASKKNDFHDFSRTQKLGGSYDLIGGGLGVVYALIRLIDCLAMHQLSLGTKTFAQRSMLEEDYHLNRNEIYEMILIEALQSLESVIQALSKKSGRIERRNGSNEVDVIIGAAKCDSSLERPEYECFDAWGDMKQENKSAINVITKGVFSLGGIALASYEAIAPLYADPCFRVCSLACRIGSLAFPLLIESSHSSQTMSHGHNISEVIGIADAPHRNAISNARLSVALDAIADVISRVLNYNPCEEESTPIIEFLAKACKSGHVHHFPLSLLMALDHLSTILRMNLTTRIKSRLEENCPAKVNDAVLVPNIISTTLIAIAMSPHMKIANPAMVSRCIAVKKSLGLSDTQDESLAKQIVSQASLAIPLLISTEKYPIFPFLSCNEVVHPMKWCEAASKCLLRAIPIVKIAKVDLFAPSIVYIWASVCSFLSMRVENNGTVSNEDIHCLATCASPLMEALKQGHYNTLRCLEMIIGDGSIKVNSQATFSFDAEGKHILAPASFRNTKLKQQTTVNEHCLPPIPDSLLALDLAVASIACCKIGFLFKCAPSAGLLRTLLLTAPSIDESLTMSILQCIFLSSQSKTCVLLDAFERQDLALLQVEARLFSSIKLDRSHIAKTEILLRPSSLLQILCQKLHESNFLSFHIRGLFDRDPKLRRVSAGALWIFSDLSELAQEIEFSEDPGNTLIQQWDAGYDFRHCSKVEDSSKRNVSMADLENMCSLLTSDYNNIDQSIVSIAANQLSQLLLSDDKIAKLFESQGFAMATLKIVMTHLTCTSTNLPSDDCLFSLSALFRAIVWSSRVARNSIDFDQITSEHRVSMFYLIPLVFSSHAIVRNHILAGLHRIVFDPIAFATKVQGRKDDEGVTGVNNIGMDRATHIKIDGFVAPVHARISAAFCLPFNMYAVGENNCQRLSLVAPGTACGKYTSILWDCCICSFSEANGVAFDEFPPRCDVADELSCHRGLVNVTKPSVRDAFWRDIMDACAPGKAMLEYIFAVKMELALLPNLLPSIARSPWIYDFLAKQIGGIPSSSIDFDIIAASCDILFLLLPYLEPRALLQLKDMFQGLFPLLSTFSDKSKNLSLYAFPNLTSTTPSKPASRSNNYKAKMLRASLWHARNKFVRVLHRHLNLIGQNNDLIACRKEYVLPAVRFLRCFVNGPVRAEQKMQYCVTCRIQANTISLLNDVVNQKGLFGQQSCEQHKLIKELTNALVDIISKPPHQPNSFILKGGMREAAMMLLAISGGCRKIASDQSVWSRPSSLNTNDSGLKWINKLLSDQEHLLRRAGWILLSNLSTISMVEWNEDLLSKVDLRPLVDDAECPSIKGEIIQFLSYNVIYHTAKETSSGSFGELLRLLANYCRYCKCLVGPHFFAAIHNASKPLKALCSTNIKSIMDSFYAECILGREDSSSRLHVATTSCKWESDEVEFIRFYQFKAAEVDLLTYFCKAEASTPPVAAKIPESMLETMCFISKSVFEITLSAQRTTKTACTDQDKQRSNKTKSILTYFASCCFFFREELAKSGVSIFRTLNDIFHLIRACERVLISLANEPMKYKEHVITLCGIFDVLVFAIPVMYDGSKSRTKDNMTSLLDVLVKILFSIRLDLQTCGEISNDGTSAFRSMHGEESQGPKYSLLHQCLKEKCAMALSMVLDVATDTSSNVLSDDFSRLLARYLLRELNANVSLFRQEHLFCNKAIDKDTPVMNSLTHGNRCCDLRFHMILLRSSMRHISFKTNALNIGLPALFDREWDLFLDYEAHKGERGTEDMFEVLLGMFCNFFNGTNTGEFNTTFIDRISRIAIGEEKRSFSIKSISIAYMILKSLFNMNKPSSTKTSISFKSFCAKILLMISAMRLKIRINAKDKCRFICSLDFLACTTLYGDGRRLLLSNHWSKLSCFLEEFIREDLQTNSTLPKEYHVLCLKILGNLSLSKTHKIDIASNVFFLDFILKKCESTDGTIRHAATTALLCLLHKSEKAIAILKKEKGEIHCFQKIFKTKLGVDSIFCRVNKLLR